MTYAALILHDAEVPVTAEALQAITKAAGVSVQPFWPSLFERVLKTQKLDDLLDKASAGAPWPPFPPISCRYNLILLIYSVFARLIFLSAPAAGAAAPAAASSAAAPAAAAAKEEPKKEEKPESDDMGFDLFG